MVVGAMWICIVLMCSGLIYYLIDYCYAMNKICMDFGMMICDDINLCIDNNCADVIGCFYMNNSY